MWGVLVSAVTIAISMATKSSPDNDAKQTSSSLSLSILDKTPFSRTFISGLCLGVGMNLLLNTLLQQFRIVERLRLYMYKSWESKEEAPLRVPSKILALLDKSNNNTSGAAAVAGAAAGSGGIRKVSETAYGSIHILLSPETAATSNLQVALLVIRPGCELVAARAPSLEFYQVLSGSAAVSQQGVIETLAMPAGHVWMVDPGSFRWISNRGATKTDLVLLRTIDSNLSTYASAESPVNLIHVDPGQRMKSLMNRFVESVKSLQQMAGSYVNKNQSSNE